MSNDDKSHDSMHNTRSSISHTASQKPDEEFESSLHIAAESGHSDLVDVLLRSGSIVDEPDSESNTALHRATKAQRLCVVQRLLWHGADPNLVNAEGRTPVHIAVSTGSIEIVKTLVRFGGDINRRAKRKGSRIDMACKYRELNGA
jgi:ankyrin repeat protein